MRLKLQDSFVRPLTQHFVALMHQIGIDTIRYMMIRMLEVQNVQENTDLELILSSSGIPQADQSTYSKLNV